MRECINISCVKFFSDLFEKYMEEQDLDRAGETLKAAGLQLDRRIEKSFYVLNNGTKAYDSVMTILSNLKDDLVSFSDLLNQVSKQHEAICKFACFSFIDMISTIAKLTNIFKRKPNM